MAEDKKIQFSAQDNVSGTVSKIYSTITDKVKAMTASQREQNKLYEQEIKLLQQKQKLLEASSKSIVSDLQKQRDIAGPGLIKSQFNQEINKERATFTGQSKENVQVIKLLTDLVAATKRNTSLTEKTERETEKDNNVRARYEDRRLAKKEALANPKLIRSKFAQTQEEGYGNMSGEEIERLHYQRGVVGNQNDPSTFRTIVGAVMTTAAIKDIMGGVKTMISSPTGTQGLTSIASGVGSGMMGMGIASGNPFLAGGGALIDLASSLFGGSTEAKYALRPGFNRMNARAGGGIGIGGNTDLGYTSLQAQGLQEGLLGASGSSNNLDKLTNQAQVLQRGLDFSETTLMQIAKAMRVVGSSNDLISVTSQVLKANPDLIKNRVLLESIVQTQTALTSSIAQSTESANVGAIGGAIGGLRAAGGNFARNPDYLATVANSINNSLTNPSNDFQKSRQLGVLSSMSPGASYFELLKMRERGTGQTGYLTNVMKQLQRETGGGENFALSAMQNFGLQAGTAEKLTKLFERNPNAFSGFQGNISEKTIQDLVSPANAAKYTPENEQIKARADEAALLGVGSNLAGVANKLLSAFTANTESSNTLTKAIEAKYENGKSNQ